MKNSPFLWEHLSLPSLFSLHVLHYVAVKGWGGHGLQAGVFQTASVRIVPGGCGQPPPERAAWLPCCSRGPKEEPPRRSQWAFRWRAQVWACRRAAFSARPGSVLPSSPPTARISLLGSALFLNPSFTARSGSGAHGVPPGCSVLKALITDRGKKIIPFSGLALVQTAETLGFADSHPQAT